MSKKIFLIITFLICTTLGCLITNCPRGGKRRDISPILPCRSCGPGLRGRCFGTNICCVSTIGCYIDTPETYNCRDDIRKDYPCIAGFAYCRDNKGRCAANGICCSEESCYIDLTCRTKENYTNEWENSQEYL